MPDRRKIIPPLLLSALAIFLLWPLVLGQMPRSQDHMVHLTRAWIFLNELVGEGRITGWSSTWFAGYPAGQLYPPGTDLWVAFFRALHFGLPDLSVTYAHAFLCFFIIGGLSVYWLALRASGSRLGAFIAGLLFLTDPGAYREGGWSFTVYWGVWSQVLGLVFLTLFLSVLDGFLDKPTRKKAVLCALLLGFSLLGHPMSLVSAVLFIPPYLLFRKLLGQWPRHGLSLVISLLILGFVLSMWWLVPFMSRGEWTIKVPALWRSLGEAVAAILRGAPFQNHLNVIGVCALFGIIHSIYRRNPLGLGLAVSSLFIIFFSTSTVYEHFELDRLSSSFSRIIYQRLSIPAKLGWFVLAGLGVSGLIEVFSGYFKKIWKGSLVRKLGLVTVIVALSLPLFFHVFRGVNDQYVGEVGTLRLAYSQEDFEDYRRFLDWSHRQWQERDRFYRIAYHQPRNDHFMADAPVYNSTPAYKIGWTPVTTFRHRPESDDPEVLRALSVRYLVSRRPVAGNHLVYEQNFGKIRVYRLRDEGTERFTLRGPGRAEVLEFGEEIIRIRVRGASEATKLTVHVSNYADWRAFHDGNAIPTIRTVPIYENRYPTFMQVDVNSDGTIEFRFVRPFLRKICQISSCIGIAILVLILFGHRLHFLNRIGRVFRRVAGTINKLVLLLSVLGLFVLLVFVGVRLLFSPEDPLDSLSYSFLENIDQATVEIEDISEVKTCRKRLMKHMCGPRSWGFVGLKKIRIGVTQRTCIWAHPYQDSILRITSRNVPFERSFVGAHGLTDFAATQVPEGTPVKLRVVIDERISSTFVAPNEFGWRTFSIDTSSLWGRSGKVTFEVSSEDHFKRQYCFQAGFTEQFLGSQGDRVQGDL